MKLLTSFRKSLCVYIGTKSMSLGVSFCCTVCLLLSELAEREFSQCWLNLILLNWIVLSLLVEGAKMMLLRRVGVLDFCSKSPKCPVVAFLHSAQLACQCAQYILLLRRNNWYLNFYDFEKVFCLIDKGLHLIIAWMSICITVVVRRHLPLTVVPVLMTILNWLYEMKWSEKVKDVTEHLLTIDYSLFL